MKRKETYERQEGKNAPRLSSKKFSMLHKKKRQEKEKTGPRSWRGPVFGQKVEEQR